MLPHADKRYHSKSHLQYATKQFDDLLTEHIRFDQNASRCNFGKFFHQNTTIFIGIFSDVSTAAAACFELPALRWMSLRSAECCRCASRPRCNFRRFFNTVVAQGTPLFLSTSGNSISLYTVSIFILAAIS